MIVALLDWTAFARALALITCALGPVAFAISGAPAVAEFAFDQYEIATGSAKGQTILTGFLLGGAVADLAVIDVDDNGDRHVRIFALGGETWAPAREATLRRDVAFVDVAGIGGQDRLITYEPGRLSWFDPESATERELVPVSCDFDAPPRDDIPHVDITRDVNGDGRDDLVVPDVAGFRVFVQRSDGTFADPVVIGASTKTRTIYGRGGYRHDPWLQSGIHEMDYDLDGRRDLVFWDQGRFRVHHQDEGGLFARGADTFRVDVPLDRGRNSCSWRPEHGFDAVEVCYESDHTPVTRGDMMEKMVHSMTDLNGDGVADLIVHSLKGKSIFSVRSTYEVHYGKATPDGRILFAGKVGAMARSDGLGVVAEQRDYDGDGQIDTMLTTMNIGFFKVAGALLSRSMSLDLEFYRMEDGVYPDEPNATRKIKLGLSRQVAGKKSVAYGSVLVGDVNGDGRSDLLVQKGRKALRVFPGVPGPELFARAPQKVAVAMPRGQEYAWLTDLDRDGKQDLLLHHLSGDDPHRVIVLMAR